VVPTKSSLQLNSNDAFLKRYLVGLFLQYSTKRVIGGKGEAKGANNKGGVLDGAAFATLLRHRADSQKSLVLPSVAEQLTDGDANELVKTLSGFSPEGSTDGGEAGTASGKSLFVTKSGALNKKIFSSFFKGLASNPDDKLTELAENPELGNGYRAAVELVRRSSALLNARRVELANIFDAYDTSGDGSIDAKELMVLLRDIAPDNSEDKGAAGGGADNPQNADGTGGEEGGSAGAADTNAVTQDDMDLFIAAMDANGDGRLGKEEFLDYCMRGMNMRPSQRKKFAKRSPMHAKLQTFVWNILQQIESTTSVAEPSMF
jgi:Ca2+-binding EF-hand superfamily protein